VGKEHKAIDVAVVGIIERAITSLQAIGMTKANALELLVIQAAILMPSLAAARRVLGSLDEANIDRSDMA
jgi:hypothetical protein